MNGKDKKQHRLYLLVIDIFSLVLSYLCAAWIRYGLPLEKWFIEVYGFFLIIVILCFICIYFITNTYDDFFKRGFYDEFVCVFRNNLFVVMIVTCILFIYQKGAIYSRAFFICFFFCNVCCNYIVRQYFKVILLSYYKKSGSSNKVLIITTSLEVEEIINKIKNEKIWNYLVTGIAIMDRNIKGTNILGINVVADKDNLLDVVTKEVVDEILISLHYEKNLQLNINEMILEFENMGIVVNMSVSSFMPNIQEKTVKYFAGYNVVTFSTKVFHTGSMVFKRIIDIVGSIIGILITLCLGIIVAPIILIESPGTVIFTQVRVGKNGRRFKIYKFRTMYNDAEKRKKELLDKNEMSGFMFKIEEDPRITKIGKILRKTSIDEFPQFFNVLKGDMSLVGTRPPTEDEFLQYKGRHKRRLTLKPGITGLWQVSGRSQISDFEDVVRLDLEYIDKWSVDLDIKLLAKTIMVVLFRIGAK